jgi:hypothetical protein
LRYHRSMFFTFLFFMPKILRNSLGEYNKSCSAPHQEFRNIICLIFLQFSREFTRISTSATLLKLPFCDRAPRSLRSLQKCPRFALRPSKRLVTLQCSPRAPAGGGPTKFQRTGGRDWPGAGEVWPAGPCGSISVLGWGRDTTGGCGRRSGAVTVARATAPAKVRLRRGKRRFGRLGWRSTVVVMRSNWSVVA